MKKALTLILCCALLIGVIGRAAAQTDDLSIRIAELENEIRQIQKEIDILVAGGTLSAPEEAAIDPALLHGMNEPVATSEGEFTLLNAKVTKDMNLVLTFKYRNTTEEEVSIRNYSFFARSADGWILDSVSNYDNPMDGSVEPGEELTGDVFFEYSGAAPYRISYEISRYLGDVVAWELNE